MNLKENFPRIMAGLEEEVDELRHLILVDVNYDDVDSDEFDVFDPSDYNYLVYVTERVQNVLGEARVKSAIEKLQQDDDFDDFYAPEADMYGVMTKLDEAAIAQRILACMEMSLS
jgi:hypothetical protein